MQTKFAALIPSLLSADHSNEQVSEGNAYFWHSFFLLKPEFLVLQNSLYSEYSIDALRFLINKCIETIADKNKDKVTKLKKVNASYLLVQVFESLWPRLREGTFGVDAINIMCGMANSKKFFDKFFNSILTTNETEVVLLSLSMLVATRDIETNALTDFFTQRCGAITKYCMQATDLHILLFSLLLQLERPSGPYVTQFRETHPPIFHSLVANLMARCSQLYVCCRPVQKVWYKKTTKPPSAVIGLFNPSDFELPMHFSLFEPFVDAAILSFLEIASSGADEAIASSALTLFTYVVASPFTAHSGDRLFMLIIAFAFMIDRSPRVASRPFQHAPTRTFWNNAIAPCVERSVGAMALDVVGFVLEIPTPIEPILGVAGRFIYQTVSTLASVRGGTSTEWGRLFTRVFSMLSKHAVEEIEFNGYAICLVSLCVSYRAALFNRDDGFVALCRALIQNPVAVDCRWAAPADFEGANEFVKKCQENVRKLVETVSAALPPDMSDEAAVDSLGKLKIEALPTTSFPYLEQLSEKPRFTSFFRMYERTHCENTQAFIHYAVGHN